MRPARLIDSTVRLDCRLRPGGRRDRVLDIAPTADGAGRLRAEVTASAEGGKANRALVKLLAPHFRIPASRWAIVVGATRCEKTLAIENVTGEEWAAIESALATLEEGETGR